MGYKVTGEIATPGEDFKVIDAQYGDDYTPEIRRKVAATMSSYLKTLPGERDTAERALIAGQTVSDQQGTRVKIREHFNVDIPETTPANRRWTVY